MSSSIGKNLDAACTTSAQRLANTTTSTHFILLFHLYCLILVSFHEINFCDHTKRYDYLNTLRPVDDSNPCRRLFGLLNVCAK
mmetsp:Transcript_31901/g.48201  ORF Transcript_31901/g.48201 Transcript_31901/m.48201 type:complete len:83 (+) Transcript_31901:558-806(+)